MQGSIIQRIKELILLKARSESHFASLIGVNQATLNYQLSGKRGLNIELIIAILTTFEDVSAEWLMRGVGTLTSNEEGNETPIMCNEEIMNAMKTINSLSSKVQELYEENQKLKEQLKEKPYMSISL